jgi:hypothetical protein
VRVEIHAAEVEPSHPSFGFDRDGGEIGAKNTQTPESIQGDMAAKRTPGTCYKTMLGEF